MFKSILGAVAVFAMSSGLAAAATLTGTFSVDFVNVTNVNSAESQATVANFNSAFAGSGPYDERQGFGTFSYIGAIDFGTFAGNDSTTIAQWLDSGSTPGGASGLSMADGGLQLSTDDIGNGTATTTFFRFTLASLGAADFVVKHDDGFAIYDDGFAAVTRIGGVNGPTPQLTTNVNGFNGGTFDLLYVATNGNPSVLNVNVSPVPLPAGLPLLLAGLGAFYGLRRRQRIAA